MEFIHQIDGIGLIARHLRLGPVDFPLMPCIVADAHRTEIALVVTRVGTTARHGDAVAFLLSLLRDDMTPFNHAGLAVIDRRGVWPQSEVFAKTWRNVWRFAQLFVSLHAI